MSNVETECLYYLAVVLIVKGEIFKFVNREKLACLFKRLYVGYSFEDFVFCNIGKVSVFFADLTDNFFLGAVFIHCNNIVGYLVNGVHRAAASVKNNIIAV